MSDQPLFMYRIVTLFTLVILSSFAVSAQMPMHGEILYGNEWYEAGSNQLRVEVSEDGFYRLSGASLAASGILQDGADLNRLQMHHLGQPVPIDVVGGDILFYGQRARSELDQHLFEFGQDMLLNTRYGIYTDTSGYYLSLAAPGTPVARYESVTSAQGGPTTSTIYRTAEKIYSKSQSKFFRRTAGVSIYFSHYELAEGYGSRNNNDLLSSNGTTITSESLQLPYAVSGEARLAVRFGLAFGDSHAQVIRVNGQLAGEVNTEGEWSLQDTAFSFSLTDDEATITIEGQAGPQDKANLAFMSVFYPAEARMENSSLAFSMPAGAPVTLIFSGNVNSASRLYDISTGKVFQSGNGRFDLPAATTEREFVLLNEAAAPAGIDLITLPDLLPPTDADYLILSSHRLAGPELEAMAAYRESAAGGGYSVHTVYVEDLYDTYGYGLRRHPQAIRNYLHAALERAPEQ